MKKLIFKAVSLLIITAVILSLSSCGLIMSSLLTDKSEIGRIERRTDSLKSATLTLDITVDLAESAECVINAKQITIGNDYYYTTNSVDVKLDGNSLSKQNSTVLYKDGTAYLSTNENGVENKVASEMTLKELLASFDDEDDFMSILAKVAKDIKPEIAEDGTRTLTLENVPDKALDSMAGGILSELALELKDNKVELTYDESYLISSIKASFGIASDVETDNLRGEILFLLSDANATEPSENEPDLEGYKKIDDLKKVIHLYKSLNAISNRKSASFTIESYAKMDNNEQLAISEVTLENTDEGFSFEISQTTGNQALKITYENGTMTYTQGAYSSSSKAPETEAKQLIHSLISSFALSYYKVTKIETSEPDKLVFTTSLPEQFNFGEMKNNPVPTYTATYDTDGELVSLSLELFVVLIEDGTTSEITYEISIYFNK